MVWKTKEEQRTYYQKNKERILKLRKRKKYQKKYNQRPEVRERERKRFKEKYHTDEAFRKRVIDSHKRWQKKHRLLFGNLGDPEVIKELCKDFGFSDDVAEAIALDGILLDKKLGIDSNY